MNHLVKNVAAVLLTTGVLSSAPLAQPQPAPLTLNSSITQVTVYSDRAQVVRSARIKLPSGEHQLLFDDLPLSIEHSSVQVSGEGNATISDVQVSTTHLSDAPDGHFARLASQREVMQDSLRIVEDRTKVALGEQSFVEAIARKLTDTTEKSSPSELDPQRWNQMLAFYRERMHGAAAELRQLESRTRQIQAEIDRLNRQIQELRSATPKARTTVVVTAHANAPTPVVVELSYIVYGPSWQPRYDLRASSLEHTLGIDYKAVVQQNSGEEWNNVALSLSTAQPARGGSSPELSPWYVGSLPPPTPYPAVPLAMQKSRSSAKEENGVTLSMAMDELQAESAPLAYLDATVQSHATSVVYTIEGRSTIGSDSREHTVAVANLEAKATFSYTSVPKLSPFAYLSAKATNSSDYVLLAGPSSIYLDNSFVAHGQLELVSPQQEFSTQLGVDEAVAIEHKLVRTFDSNQGVMGKKSRKVYEYLISVHNTKKTVEQLTVRDQLPLSQNEQIRVELLKPSLNEKSGSPRLDEQKMLTWELSLEPGAKVELPLVFAVEYPRDMPISGLE
jgi:uncharacterized protein (TIGR02231 family)